MSLLVEVRQRSARFHWVKAEELEVKCQKEIDFRASQGHVEFSFPVSNEDYVKGRHLIQALKLEGFTADWVDHRHEAIRINWEVRLPRS